MTNPLISLAPRTGANPFDPTWDDGRFYFEHGTVRDHLNGSVYFQTVERRDEVLAGIRKFAKARPSNLVGGGASRPGIAFNVKLKADEVNGGANETGVKRFRAFVADLDAQGVSVHYRDHSTMIRDESRRAETFEAATRTVAEINALLGGQS